MAKDDGGSAFPVPQHEDIQGFTWAAEFGMSLRDYMATHALSGWLASAGPNERPIPNDLAIFAYDVADAMLKARNT